ncbi:unnamed protein product [Sympodiomycopsis kandeliae]
MMSSALQSATRRATRLAFGRVRGPKQARITSPQRVGILPRSYSTTAQRFRSDDPGGKPNDGSHSTVYDDFYNLLAPTDPNAEVSLSIEAINPTTITLSDGLVLECPMMILNGYCFLWDPPKLDSNKAIPNGSGWEEWTSEEGMQEIWKLVDVVEPKPEVLLFGTGATVLPPPPKIRSYLNSLGIQLEVQSSQNAASTFNVLSEEGRKVAIALLLSDGKPVERKSNKSSSSKQIPSGSRSFSTSARSQFMQSSSTSASSASSSSSVLQSLQSNLSSSSSPPSSRRPKQSGEPSKLTLHHFLLRSSIYSLYRTYIRSTQSIPNSIARYETLQFYRPEFIKVLNQLDLKKAKELLDYQKREFKRISPTWELLDQQQQEGGGKVIAAKFRGGNQ